MYFTGVMYFQQGFDVFPGGCHVFYATLMYVVRVSCISVKRVDVPWQHFGISQVCSCISRSACGVLRVFRE